MRITMHAPDLDPAMRAAVAIIRNKLAFIKGWANAAAKEARANARAKGGRKYWRDLARSIQVRGVSPTAADVSSAQIGATLKQFGGTVRPVHKSALTIPIAPEAKGKTAYELNKPSKPLFRPRKTNILAVSNKDGTIKPLFALVKSAVQRPDPWFPDDNRINWLGRREAAWMAEKERKLWDT